MKQTIAITLLTLCTSLSTFSQVKVDSLCQLVLNNNIEDSLYVFGQWDQAEGTETYLKYLGVVTSNKGHFKILTSCWLWGPSKRATNRILLFNEENTYLGNYYLTTTSDLPEKIEHNQLLFLHAQSDVCDKQRITKLSFEDGIPEQFFLECKNGFGDVYSFTRATD